MIDQLADYLDQVRGDVMPVLPVSTPKNQVEYWRQSLERGEEFSANQLVEELLAQSNHFHHPGNVGHQVSAPLPVVALMELVAGLLNNGMAVYETGPASTAIEVATTQWLAKHIGWPNGGGILTSGGSLGNLTALLAARQAKAGYDAWTMGAHQGPPLALIVSEQAHYCVGRAARIMGWGDDGVILAKTDEHFRMRAEHVERAIEQANEKGRKIVAVVASACTTSTGTFDCLNEIADVCEKHQLWMHVDGAHGASMLLSSTKKHLLDSIERADSVVWDAHKMMLTPALVTAVLFRDHRRSFEAFAQQAAYLFSGEPHEEQWHNLGLRTLECTKRMMSIKLYSAIKTLGASGLGQYIDAMCSLASYLAQRVSESSDLELGIWPDCNIVCFRHKPNAQLTQEQLDQHQVAIRTHILQTGSFYLVQTRLPMGVFLRTTIINPQTREIEIDNLLKLVSETGQGLVTKTELFYRL